MTKKYAILGIVLGLTCGYAQSQNATVTIYKDGQALINQPLQWDAVAGLNTFRTSNFSQLMLKDSPFLSLTKGTIISQVYDENIFSYQDYYKNQRGNRISVKPLNEKPIDGQLLDFDANTIVIQTRSTVQTFLRPQIQYFEFNDILPAIRIRPELIWTVRSDESTSINGNLMYLTSGLDWEAVYRLILNGIDQSAQLVPQALVENTTDLEFSSASLNLVEGNLNRVAPPRYPSQQRAMMRADAMMLGVESAPPELVALGDFHIYSITGQNQLKPKQTTTLKLYDPCRIKYQKTYIFDNYERQKKEEPLSIRLSFDNKTENGLGIPLPQGQVDMYYQNETGSLTYAGSDNLKQVPRGEAAVLQAGRAFDVVGKHIVLNYDRQQKTEEATIQIEIKNVRTDTIIVKAIEHITGDWVIRNETTMYIKEDASTIYFPVTIPPGQTNVISYTYRKAFK